MQTTDLVVLYEHPEWQKPLFAALERRGVSFAAFDLKRASFDPDEMPHAKVYFNQASPSAYVRGNARAVPLAYALMRSLELGGARVFNGYQAFALELSKTAQAALMRKLGIASEDTRLQRCRRRSSPVDRRMARASQTRTGRQRRTHVPSART